MKQISLPDLYTCRCILQNNESMNSNQLFLSFKLMKVEMWHYVHSYLKNEFLICTCLKTTQHADVFETFSTFFGTM